MPLIGSEKALETLYLGTCIELSTLDGDIYIYIFLTPQKSTSNSFYSLNMTWMLDTSHGMKLPRAKNLKYLPKAASASDLAPIVIRGWQLVQGADGYSPLVSSYALVFSWRLLVGCHIRPY